MSRRKTKWFLGEEKPARAGVYERNYSSENARAMDRHVGKAFCHWNGEYWGKYGKTPDESLSYKGNKSINQEIPWRGLTEDPSAAPSVAAVQLDAKEGKHG